MGLRSKVVVTLSAAFLILGGAGAFAADGDGGDSSVTAVVDGIAGERYVSAAPPVTLALQAGTSNMSASLALQVTEAARSGTAEWSLQTQLDADLSATLTDLSIATIARSQMTLDPGTTLAVGGGGTITNGSSGTLESVVTVFTNTGQDPNLAYTGTYTTASTLTLAIPNATPAGTYTGNISVTLVQ